MSTLPKKNLLAALISSALIFTGCGGGGGSSAPGAESDLTDGNGDVDNSDTGRGTDTPVNPYSGASNISGTISLSSLTGPDADSVETGSGAEQRIATRRARASVDAAGNAILKLYSVGANGELEDTGLACDFDGENNASGNPTYSCDGVADGNNYVIKYVRILENNRALEMKVNVQVPDGVAEVPADDVSPASTVISDTIINAILTATEGKEIDQEILDDIISSVEEVVKTLVSSGAVQLPSVIGEAPKNEAGEFITDIAVLDSEEEVDFAENEDLGSTSGSLLSDEAVSAEVDAVRVEIEIRDLTAVDTTDTEGKRKLITKIFENLLEGDVPRFMVDFFADKFESDETIDVATLFDAVYAGIEVEEDLVDIDLDELGITPEDTTANLQATLNQIHALFGRKAADTLTEEDKRNIAEAPAIIPAIFPAGTSVSVDSALNIPQAIVYTIFVADKYIPELIEDETGIKVDEFINVEKTDGGESEDGEGPVNVEFEHVVDFDPMYFDESGKEPGLLQVLGFFDDDYLGSLSGIDIGRLRIHPENIWIEDRDGGNEHGPSGREYDSLRADVCVSDLSVMAGMMTGEAQGSDFSVELGYPTRSGGRGSVALLNEHELHGGFNPVSNDDGMGDPEGGHGDEPEFESCFVLDPWAAAHQSQSTGEFIQPAVEDIVSDFASGQYNVTVRNSEGVVVAEREYKRKVIVGMRNANPRLVSPNGRPEWPQECNGAIDRCDEWDERQKKFRENGGNTTFALNVDTDNDGTNDQAEVTIRWNKPGDLELPEGVKIAYSMDVVKNDQSANDFNWENIYSSHQNDKRLFGNSFTLPTTLDQLEAGNGNYHINLCAEFIDTDNGEFLGRGGCGFAEFNIGEPIDLNAEFTIEGNAPKELDGQWKVALINERHQPPSDTSEPTSGPEVTTISVSQIDADGKYELRPTLADFLNQPLFSHTSLILFKDDNNDGQAQNSPDGDQHEHFFWPPYNETNVRFETWDNVLRLVTEEVDDEGNYNREETLIKGGKTFAGPDFGSLKDDSFFRSQVGGEPGDGSGFGDDVNHPDQPDVDDDGAGSVPQL